MDALDDTDEFQPRAFFWAHVGTRGNHEVRLPAFWGPPGTGKTAPKLFAHQEAVLNLYGGVRVPQAVVRGPEVRKGQAKPRKTPLLCNTPRTTPETAKYLPDRQHSSV